MITTLYRHDYHNRRSAHRAYGRLEHVAGDTWCSVWMTPSVIAWYMWKHA